MISDKNKEDLEILNNYLCEIKKSLPFPIRLNKKETNCILDEIEDHIWEKVIDNIGDQEPRREDIEYAISEMGSPIDIANNYPIKSTPFVYISEEFFPIYIKWLRILFGFFIISMFFVSGDYFSVGVAVRTVFLVFLFIFFFINILFFYISSKGYLPGDIYRIYLHKKHKDSKLIYQKKVKKPINRIKLIVWLILWLFGIFISILQIINDLNSAYTYSIVFFLGINLFILTFFIMLFIIDLIRFYINFKFIKTQQFLLILKTSIIFFFATAPRFFNQQDLVLNIQFLIEGIVNESYNILDVLIGFLNLCFWLVFIGFIYYNFYKILTFNEKIKSYLTNKSLERRYLKKKSYIDSLILNNIDNLKFSKNKSEDLNLRNPKIYETIIGNVKIKKFIRKLEKKLPRWLTYQEKEEFLTEMNEIIQEIALEISDKNELTEFAVDHAIKRMGSINSIISSVKQRTKPKIYISKEIWPHFILVSKVVVSYILFIAFYVKILEMMTSTSHGDIGQLFTLESIIQLVIYINNFLILLIVLILIIFFIFIYISMKDIFLSNKKSLDNKKFFKNKNLSITTLEICQCAIYIMFSIIMLILHFQFTQWTLPITSSDILVSIILISLSLIKLTRSFLTKIKSVIKKTLSLISVIFNVGTIFFLTTIVLDIFSVGIPFIIISFAFILVIVLFTQLFIELILYFLDNPNNKSKLLNSNLQIV